MADTATAATPKIRHEEFCLPRPGSSAPRIESYVYMDDDPKSGRSRPTHDVFRCIECGAANYKQRS
jgi:hypothetical protein